MYVHRVYDMKLTASLPPKINGTWRWISFWDIHYFQRQTAFVSFQGWCISMYFWKMSIFLHNNLHHPSRSTIWKNGRLLGGKVFFSSNKRHLITFSAPPPPPRKMGNLFIEVTLCLYKGCSIPTSRIIVTSHEFRILLIDQPVFRVVFLHVRGQLV